MTIFLILAPYGAFASLMLVASATESLIVAVFVSLGTIALDAVRGRSLKILPTGTAILFAGVAGYLHLIDPALSDKAVKLAIDVGVFAISFGSMVVRYPFTMQYALEALPAEMAAMPGFMRANYIITGVWTTSTLLMMLTNAAILYIPSLPLWIGLAVAFAARNSAVYFTKWYSACRRAKFARLPVDALPKPH